MKQFPNSQGHLVVIERGEEVVSKLAEYVREHGLRGAWMSGLGGASDAILGFYDLKARDYKWIEYSQPLEILNLTGNLSWVDGEPFWHVHGNFSGEDLQAFGGHVRSLTVGLTCEVLITPLDTALTRKYDDETGLKLLSSLNK